MKRRSHPRLGAPGRVFPQTKPQLDGWRTVQRGRSRAPVRGSGRSTSHVPESPCVWAPDSDVVRRVSSAFRSPRLGDATPPILKGGGLLETWSLRIHVEESLVPCKTCEFDHISAFDQPGPERTSRRLSPGHELCWPRDQ